MRAKSRSVIHSYERSQSAKKLSNGQLSFSSEGINATRRRSGRKPSVESSVQYKRGRRRGSRSMGRFPFLNAANQYLKAMKGLLAETTWVEYERRLRRMDKDFRTLVDTNVIDNYNPWKMTDKEILAYLK
jgi:hypothetical protein